MPPTRTTTTTTPAPMTDAAIKALIAQGVADALAEIKANRTSRNGDDSYDLGTGSRRTERDARECTYNDFLKCQPLNFNGTEGVVSLTQWFKNMESVFHISNCIVACQINFATCTLLGSALTWWNSYVKTVVMIMFPEESDKVEKYVGGLPDMIQESVMASKPKIMQDAIEKFDDTSRNNQNQQQPFKRHNVARAYTAGPMEKKVYGGSKPMCPKCNYHHDGQCAPKCTNCKRNDYLAQDYRSQPAAANNQRSPGENQRGVTCIECRAQGHFKRDFPKLKNNNRGNQARNSGATARAYAMGTTWTNLNSNVVMSMFLPKNRYALILFDTGADKSFVSTAFCSLIDIIPTTLDHVYDIELPNDRSYSFGNEILIVRGDGSNNGHESRLNIISCTKTQKYLLKEFQVFLAHITTKKAEDKSEEKRLEDVPIVRDFPE
ncbi:hypothetical protein Tco_0984319, partial [Tanacetum coccineum]